MEHQNFSNSSIHIKLNETIEHIVKESLINNDESVSNNFTINMIVNIIYILDNTCWILNNTSYTQKK